MPYLIQVNSKWGLPQEYFTSELLVLVLKTGAKQIVVARLLLLLRSHVAPQWKAFRESRTSKNGNPKSQENAPKLQNPAIAITSNQKKRQVNQTRPGS